MSYPISDIKRSLKKIEAETAKLKKLTQSIPGVQKNITPIMAFIDILRFHLNDLEEND